MTRCDLVWELNKAVMRDPAPAAPSHQLLSPGGPGRVGGDQGRANKAGGGGGRDRPRLWGPQLELQRWESLREGAEEAS